MALFSRYVFPAGLLMGLIASFIKYLPRAGEVDRYGIICDNEGDGERCSAVESVAALSRPLRNDWTAQYSWNRHSEVHDISLAADHDIPPPRCVAKAGV